MRALVSCVIIFILVSSVASLVALGSYWGPPGGFTGAPAVLGRTCTVCHPGKANTGPGRVVITAPEEYVPGSIIPVSVSVEGLQNPYVNGFQIAAYEDASNELLPGWTSSDVRTQVKDYHLCHTKLGTYSARWEAYFQAPSAELDFTFYAAGLDANGNACPGGDEVYTTNRPMRPGAPDLSLMALPRLGTTLPLALHAPTEGSKLYVLAASFGTVGVNVGPHRIPLSADHLFWGSVEDRLVGLFVDFKGVLSPDGRASATVNLPDMPALADTAIYFAFVVIDPSRPGGISFVSKALPATLF